ncbi:hypothetical protein MPSEU_000882900 [Mayamaea pseudoterrestris]|nr:hypothetical protein MPSEU_000882900 [Mayamaea pseudoterrestris]
MKQVQMTVQDDSKQSKTLQTTGGADILEQLYAAVDSKDFAKVAALLDYDSAKQSNSIDEALVVLPLQSHVSFIQQQQQQQHQQQILQVDATSTPTATSTDASSRLRRHETFLLALLSHSVPTAYELFWMAATDITINTQHSLETIQQFLYSAAAAWCQYERQQSTASFPHGHKARKMDTCNQSTHNSHITGSSSKTPRDYILVLVKQAMSKLLLVVNSDFSSQGNQSTDKIVLDDERAFAKQLLASIVSLAQASLNDEHLFHKSMDCVMMLQQEDETDKDASTVHSMATLVPWLKLVTQLSKLWRPSDWTRILQIVQNSRLRKTDATEKVDMRLVKVADAITALALAAASTTTSNTDAPTAILPNRRKSVSPILSQQHALTEECLHSLMYAMHNAAKICTSLESLVVTANMEQVVLERLASFSHRSRKLALLNGWAGAVLERAAQIEDDAKLMAGIHCNMVLLIVRASRQQSNRNDLFSSVLHALNRSGKSYDVGKAEKTDSSNHRHDIIQSICWTALVTLTMRARSIGDVLVSSKVPQRQHVTDAAFIGQKCSIFDDVRHTGHGVLVDYNGRQNALLSHAATVIVNSLHLGHDALTESYTFHSADRARVWANLAMHLIERPVTCEGPSDWILACLILTVVYVEAPVIQTFIVQKMTDHFTGVCFFERQFTARSKIISHAISNIIATTGFAGIQTPTCALNGLAAVFSKELPLDIFIEIAACLAPLESARLAMLNFSRKTLKRPDLPFVLASMAPTGVKRLDEELNSIQCGLYALVELVAAARRDDCETEAWMMLLQIIISCMPSLPLSSRLWLFGELCKRVAAGHLRPNDAEPLLAAVMLRLTSFLSRSEECSERFLPSKVFVKSQHADHPTEQTDDVAGLLRLAIDLCHAVANGDADFRLFASDWHRHLFQLVWREEVATARFPNIDIQAAKIEYSLIYSTFLFVARIMESIACASFSALAQHSLSDLESRLLNEAQLVVNPPLAMLSSLVGREVYNSQGSWRSLRSSQPAVEELSSFNRTLCAVVLDLLIGSRWAGFNAASHLESLSTSDRRRAVLGLSRLITMSMSSLPLKCAISDGSAFCMFGAYRNFTTLLTPVFKSCLSTGAPQADIDAMVNATTLLCAAVSKLMDAVEPAHSLDLVPSTLRLYSTLCNEDASAQLRLFYVSVSNGRSDAEIDLSIRNFRFNVVSVLTKCIPVELCDESGGSINSSVNIDEPSHPLELLCDIIAIISNDLVEGMVGSSGMVDYDLFEAYHACMHASVREALIQLPSCRDKFHLRRLASVCNRAGKKLQRLVCSYALRQSGIFKMSLMLSMYNLPFLARTAIRQLRLKGDSGEIDRHQTSPGCKFCSDAFKQCVNIMDRRDVNKLWEDFVGSEHMLYKYSDPRTESHHLAYRYLQLTTESHWIWAFCTTLEGFEYLWDESLICFKDAGAESFSSDECAKRYMIARQGELTEVWKSTACLFTNEKVKGSSCFKATLLPSRVKLRALALLDRIVGVQQKALRTILLCAGKCCKREGTRHLDVVESLVCILVWLDTLDSLDLIWAAAKWYAVEEEYKQKIKSALLRIEYAQANLQQLKRVLQSSKLQNVCFIAGLNRLSNSRIDASDHSKDSDSDYRDEDQGGRLLQLVKSKLSVIERSQQELTDSECALKKAREAEIARRARKERGKKIFRSRNKAIDEMYEDDKKINVFYIQKSGFDDAFDDDPYADLEDFLVEG